MGSREDLLGWFGFLFFLMASPGGGVSGFRGSFMEEATGW